MSITLRPFRAEIDQTLVESFLRDTQQLTGTVPSDSNRDAELYIKSVLSAQKTDPFFCTVLEDQGTAIGFVDAHPIKSTPRIGILAFDYVIPERRGQGLGRYIIEFALKKLKEHGCTTVRLNVARGNLRAISFYEKQGWRMTGEEKGDFLFMIKEI